MTITQPDAGCPDAISRREGAQRELADFFADIRPDLNGHEDPPGNFQFAMRSRYGDVRIALSLREAADDIVMCGKLILPLAVTPENCRALTEFAAYANEYLSIPHFSVFEDKWVEMNLDSLASNAAIADVIFELLLAMSESLWWLLPGFACFASGCGRVEDLHTDFGSLVRDDSGVHDH